MAEAGQKSSLELLFNVSRELASALDLRTVLQRILFQSLKYVGGERASIVVLDEEGKALDSAIVYGRKMHDHTTQQLRETFPETVPYRYVGRDRDSKFNVGVSTFPKATGMPMLRLTPASPRSVTELRDFGGFAWFPKEAPCGTMVRLSTARGCSVRQSGLRTRVGRSCGPHTAVR